MALPAFIPEGAKWFLADLVVEIRVGKRKRVSVHVNTVLVRAGSAIEAHRRALALGRLEESRYENAAGEQVAFKFLGLRNLDVVHDELEHGCELRYVEKLGITPRKARGLVAPRAKLAVFRPRTPSSKPDYMSGRIRRALDDAMGTAQRKGAHTRQQRKLKRD